jgi:methylthioribose-1-phosphate isomerase
MYVAQPIAWTEAGVVMLDQRRLPAEEISYTYTDYRDVAKAIREMVIRGRRRHGRRVSRPAFPGQIRRRTPR